MFCELVLLARFIDCGICCKAQMLWQDFVECGEWTFSAKVWHLGLSLAGMDI